MVLKAPPPDAHWRDSARPAKFFIIDFRAVFPVFFCLLRLRVWTLVTASVFVAFFAVLHRYGFTLEVFGRWLRATLAGKRRMAAPWWM